MANNVGFLNYESGAPKSTVFEIKNISDKTICVFGLDIKPGRSYNLLDIPYISEADIRSSLLKGTLYKKGIYGEFVVESSNIDLIQFDDSHKDFLTSIGITSGTEGGGGGSGPEPSPTASAVTYSNSTSGLTSSNVQGAIDELSNDLGEVNTASSKGAGQSIVLPKDGKDLPFKSLISGPNISISSQAETLTIGFSGSAGEVNSATNAGDGIGLALPKSGVSLPFKSLKNGSNISITEQSNTVTIGFTGSLGEVNTTSNSGSGVGIALPKSGVNFPFKSLVAGAGIDIADGANAITLSFSGTIPTTATDLSYSGTASGLSATDVQGAIDELKGLIDALN